MLRAPDSALTFNNNLRLQDAVNSLLQCVTSPAATIHIYKTVNGLLLRNISEELQHANHRAIVESNMRVVAFGIWKVLGPAAVRVLGFQ
jgi:hypothetical protein